MEKLGPEEASLESLIETELLKLQNLHPGGLELTEELAELCQVRRGTEVLELACGTGESACFLAERLGCPVVSLRSDNGLVFGLFYDQAQPRPLLGTRSLSVRWSPSPRERMPAGRCRGGV